MRVAVSSPGFSRNEDLLRELGGVGVKVVANQDPVRLDESGLLRFWRETGPDAAIVGLEPVTAEVLDACPHVRLVAKYGVGLDNLDLDALRDRGVALGWSPGVNKRSVSELVLAFSFGHMRNVFGSMRRMSEGEWVKDGGRQVSDTVYGIVGLGNIGTDLARALRVLNCTVLYNDIEDRAAVAEELGLRATTYRELLAEAGIISFHVPSTDLTRFMFGPRQILLTGSNTLIINTSRGDIVDFEAVVAAVQSRNLGGFATDVYPSEPMDVSHLSGIPGLYFTPHIGGNSAEGVMAMGRSAIAHVREFVLRMPKL